MPATVLVLAGAASVYLRSREVPFLEPILIGIGLLTALLLGLWYIFLTGLRWRTRLPWNNPVLLRDLLLVRNDQEAACYRLPLSTSKP